MKPLTINPASALIVVDVQNDFCPGGKLAVPHGEEVIPVINKLMKEFPLTVASQDWHPDDHKSFAKNHLGKEPGDVIDLNGTQQVLWPSHCVQETWGAKFVKGLDIYNIATSFKKGFYRETDSYSAFFDNDRIIGTGLRQYLKDRRIKHVCVVGLATDYCVKYTALDAVKLGFHTDVKLNGCRGIELKEGDIQRSIEEMQKAGVAICY